MQLTDEQIADVRRIAGRRGSSMASVMRDAVDALVRREGDEQRERVRRALAAAGAGRSRRGDLAENHDEYFVEAADDRHA